MPTTLSDLFGTSRPLIGMVHLLPLPGSPRWGGSLDRVLERALEDARKLENVGFDGVVVENYCDVPFYPETVPPETVAAMSVCVREVVKTIAIPVGVNLLRNDGPGAVAIAAVTGARFVRINVHTGMMATDQGFLSGRAYETTRLRQRLGANVAIFADVWVKHATPFPGAELRQAAEDAVHRGLADALIVTGSGTGKATDLTRVKLVKRAVPNAPVFIGSGLSTENAFDALKIADGAIVGSSICRRGTAGNGIDWKSAGHLVRSARSSPAVKDGECEIRLIDTHSEYLAALQVRIAVFVEEQGGPISDEPDESDPAAQHVIVLSAGEIVGTARIFQVKRGHTKLGRICLLPEYRGRGWGERLLQYLIRHARAIGSTKIELNAQTHALPFYERFGFTAVGEEFFDGGIPHWRMELIDPDSQ